LKNSSKVKPFQGWANPKGIHYKRLVLQIDLTYKIFVRLNFKVTHKTQFATPANDLFIPHYSSSINFWHCSTRTTFTNKPCLLQPTTLVDEGFSVILLMKNKEGNLFRLKMCLGTSPKTMKITSKSYESCRSLGLYRWGRKKSF
jgi:hypothetical protein